MARLNVNPTRMVYSSLKNRLATSKRGHKLLKDKQDELMRQFIDLAKENKRLREEVERELISSFKSFSIAGAVMNPEMLENALFSSNKKIGVEVSSKNIMSVQIPQMKFSSSDSTGFSYGYVQTSYELDRAISGLEDVMKKLMKLTEIEKSCELMAEEIESTRRRVNALEYRTIPTLIETIKYIRMKLDENDRATITRLLKVKDLIADDSDKEYYDSLNAKYQSYSEVVYPKDSSGKTSKDLIDVIKEIRK